jgi:hypothetical protein
LRTVDSSQPAISATSAEARPSVSRSRKIRRCFSVSSAASSMKMRSTSASLSSAMAPVGWLSEARRRWKRTGSDAWSRERRERQ